MIFDSTAEIFFGIHPPMTAISAWGARAIVSSYERTEPIVYRSGPRKGRQKYTVEDFHGTKLRFYQKNTFYYGMLDIVPDRTSILGTPPPELFKYRDELLRSIREALRTDVNYGKVKQKFQQQQFHAQIHSEFGYMFIGVWEESS